MSRCFHETAELHIRDGRAVDPEAIDRDAMRRPFIIEGLIVGFLGAATAVAVLLLGKVTIVDPLSERFALVDNLNTIDFVPLVGVLVACAMAVSALGSGVTLRRFLRV